MAFTVGTEACTASLNWSGVEGLFAAGFPALDPTHITVTYQPAVGAPIALTAGIHFAAVIDAAGAVTVTPIAMPAAPGLVIIDRHTPAIQATDFSNLTSFTGDIHTQLHDAAAMRDAELRRDLARAIGGTALPASLLFTARARVQRSVTATPIVLTTTDEILNLNINADAACALPLSTTRGGLPLTFKDVGAHGGAHNVTFTPGGAEKIDGAVSFKIEVDRQGLTLVPFNDGVNNGWAIE